MVTNVNFSPTDFVELIDEAVRRKNSLRKKFLNVYQQKHEQPYDQVIPEEAEWQYEKVDEQVFTDLGATVGIETQIELLDEDVLAMQECLLYAVKGLGALAVHSLELDIEDIEQYRFMQQALSFTLTKIIHWMIFFPYYYAVEN